MEFQFGFKPVDILMVEDSLGDARMTQEAFKEGKIINRLYVTGDGIDALAFLRKEGPYEAVPRPDLILLDLNLPRMDGREFLTIVKEDPDLRRIPIVVLTSSMAEQDIIKSYDLHANCYVTKPVSIDQFVKVVHTVEDFWFTIVRLPPDVF